MKGGSGTGVGGDGVINRGGACWAHGEEGGREVNASEWCRSRGGAADRQTMLPPHAKPSHALPCMAHAAWARPLASLGHRDGMVAHATPSSVHTTWQFTLLTAASMLIPCRVRQSKRPVLVVYWKPAWMGTAAGFNAEAAAYWKPAWMDAGCTAAAADADAADGFHPAEGESGREVRGRVPSRSIGPPIYRTLGRVVN